MGTLELIFAFISTMPTLDKLCKKLWKEYADFIFEQDKKKLADALNKASAGDVTDLRREMEDKL